MNYLKVESKWQYLFRLLLGTISCALILIANDSINENFFMGYGLFLLFTYFCIILVELYSKNYFKKLCIKRRNDMKEENGYINSYMKLIIIFIIFAFPLVLYFIVFLDFAISSVIVTGLSKILFFITNKQVWVIMAYILLFLISYFIGTMLEIVAFLYFAFKHSEFDDKNIIEE